MSSSPPFVEAASLLVRVSLVILWPSSIWLTTPCPSPPHHPSPHPPNPPQPSSSKTLRPFPSLNLRFAAIESLTTTPPYRLPNPTLTAVPPLTKTPYPWPIALCHHRVSQIHGKVVDTTTVRSVITSTSQIIKQHLYRLLGSCSLTGDLLLPPRTFTMPRSLAMRPPQEPPPLSSMDGLNGTPYSTTPLHLSNFTPKSWTAKKVETGRVCATRLVSAQEDALLAAMIHGRTALEEEEREGEENRRRSVYALEKKRRGMQELEEMVVWSKKKEEMVAAAVSTKTSLRIKLGLG